MRPAGGCVACVAMAVSAVCSVRSVVQILGAAAEKVVRRSMSFGMFLGPPATPVLPPVPVPMLAAAVGSPAVVLAHRAKPSGGRRRRKVCQHLSPHYRLVWRTAVGNQHPRYKQVPWFLS
eukprot:COSAG05_NODE_1218_length_5483_cov_330.229569_3_plen_120_part_00